MEESKDDDLSETVTISTKKTQNGDVTNDDVKTIPTLKDIEEEVKKERAERSLSSNDVLFVGIAWIVVPLFRFFMLNPEVVWLDVTSHSNNKGFHLLTFSAKTAFNKMVVFLWSWIPNQQRFSFRWIFQHAIPNLIPKWLRDRVRFVMKDGDPQQRNEIIFAFQNVFVNAIEGGCGFHIGKFILCTNYGPQYEYNDLMHLCLLYTSTSYQVNFGWERHCPGPNTITKPNRPRWLSIVRKIHQWIYSWMKPAYVEDEFEYKISKCLLIQFLCSATVLSGAEGKAFMIVQILKWLQQYVFVYEGLYLHYLRMGVCNFKVEGDLERYKGLFSPLTCFRQCSFGLGGC